MKRHMIAAMAIAVAITGCTVKKAGDAPSIEQALINIGLRTGAMAGCARIKESDRAKSIEVIADIEALAAGNPDIAYARLIRLSNEPAFAQLWASIHSELDVRYELTPSTWTIAAKAGLTSAIEGCRAGLLSTQAAGGGSVRNAGMEGA